MDESLHQKKKVRAPKPPKGDFATVDLFTGEPIGAPPGPRKISKGARTLLEYVIARESVNLTELAGTPPEGINAGALSGLVAELRRGKMIVDTLPPEPRPGFGYDPSKLVTIATEEGRDWLRRRRIEEQGKEPPKPKEQPDPAQQSLVADDSALFRFLLAQTRLVLRKNQAVGRAEVWHEVGRSPRGPEEEQLGERALREAASRGWCRKVGDHYRSMIYEPPGGPHG